MRYKVGCGKKNISSRIPDWRQLNLGLHIVVGIEIGNMGYKVFINTVLTIGTADT